MLSNYNIFLEQEEVRNIVISDASKKVSLSIERVSEYYANEVSNLLSTESIRGLMVFLEEVCEVESNPHWFDHF